MRRNLLIATVLSALALPASASAATFTVNVAGAGSDDVSGGGANGVCDTSGDPGNQCTLREALKEANAKSNNDTIKFSSSVFQGVHLDDYIFLDSGPLSVTREVSINGRNCAGSGTAKPCVGLDTNGASGLLVTADDVDIRGLAVFGANNFADSYGIVLEGDGDTVKGSWFGVDLAEGFGFNSNGIVIQNAGDDAVIGGRSSLDRNVFGFGFAGDNFIRIIDADNNRIRGNFLGVKADGTSAAGGGTGIAIESDANDAVGNVIGASIDSAHRATTKCDGGCNVIAGGSTGIFDDGERTKIKGNFIGLDKTGMTALPMSSNGIDERGDGATIGGGTSADRNFITGGVFGIFKFAATDMSVKRNFIGLDSAGTGIPTGSTLDVGVVLGTDGVASRNRIAGCDEGIRLDNDGGRAVRNKIGIGKDGGNLAGASNLGINAWRADGVVGEPGAGNTIGNSGDGIVITPGGGGSNGDGNKVQGNYIGVDSAGVARPNTGVGVSLTPSGSEAPDDNVIGGGSAAHENVISNSGTDAIRILGGPPNPERNLIKRNRGKDNGDPMSTDCDGGPCDLFIDIGPDGFGNLAGPNDQIDAPDLTNEQPGDATRTHLEGTARENATIYIFRTSAAADLSPNRINAFVKQVSVGGGNEWSANFSQIPAGQRLTALQIDPNGNASELALAVDPVGP